MSLPYVVTVTAIEEGYRKPPLAPLNSALKTGLEAMLGASLVAFINSMRCCFATVCCVRSVEVIIFISVFCLSFWHISVFGATRLLLFQTMSTSSSWWWHRWRWFGEDFSKIRSKSNGFRIPHNVLISVRGLKSVRGPIICVKWQVFVPVNVAKLGEHCRSAPTRQFCDISEF